MKKQLLIRTGIVLFAVLATWVLKAQFAQREPEASLSLTKPEMEALYQIVDDAAVPGQIRKPILQKISTAYTGAFMQKTEIKKDTTKPQKP